MDNTKDNLEPLIIHHRGCSDGICGAMVLWLGLGRRGELLAAQYGDAPPPDEVVRNRAIYVVDFSYPRAELERLHELASSIVVLDHHKTAEAALAGLDFCEFDMERSGARMALDYVLDHLPPRGAVDGAQLIALNELVNYVQDRDLWRWKLPNSLNVSAWLASWPRTLEKWVDIWDYWATSGAMASIICEGGAILRREEQLVEILAAKAHAGCWWPRTGLSSCALAAPPLSCMLVNAPILQSEVAGELAGSDDIDFAVAWWQRADGAFQYSLRSRGDCNVSEIAAQYGGGGHAQAAGFEHLTGPWGLFGDYPNPTLAAEEERDVPA